MIDDKWISSSLNGLPAFVYGNGGCFNGTLTMDDLVYVSDNYYQIDFSGFVYDCTVELSLISSIGTDGAAPENDMSNWHWWQNEEFCSSGSNLCQLMDNGTSWEEWLVRVSWSPDSGLSADGNGFISNNQL